MWLTYIIIAVLLLAAELIYFRIADKCNIIDKPNERSSHKTIVLRGGGVIFAISMLLWLILQMVNGEWLMVKGYLPFIIGLVLVAGISFVDDIHSLPDSVRLVAQFTAMMLMFWSWGILQWSYWWIILLCLILCVGITNAYNFMDGINGINAGYTLAILLPLAWLNTRYTFTEQSLIWVAILADLVFSFFNFRPKGKAKCFAGDVGSVGCAFIVIFLLGQLIIKTGDFTYSLMLVVYGVDTVLTICHRILLHEHLGEAHRKHAYQLMANELGMEHTMVSTIYSALQLAIAAGLILIPNTPYWHWGYYIGVTIILVIAYLLFMKKYYHLHEEYLASLKK